MTCLGIVDCFISCFQHHPHHHLGIVDHDSLCKQEDIEQTGITGVFLMFVELSCFYASALAEDFNQKVKQRRRQSTLHL